jgi:hypothetical protein
VLKYLAANATQGLEDEKGALRLAQKDLRRKHVQLAEERAAKDEHVLEQRARCRDVQMLKFGQEIDIALLDTIGARNRAADELRRALKEQVGMPLCLCSQKCERPAHYRRDAHPLVGGDAHGTLITAAAGLALGFEVLGDGQKFQVAKQRLPADVLALLHHLQTTSAGGRACSTAVRAGDASGGAWAGAVGSHP